MISYPKFILNRTMLKLSCLCTTPACQVKKCLGDFKKLLKNRGKVKPVNSNVKLIGTSIKKFLTSDQFVNWLIDFYVYKSFLFLQMVKWRFLFRHKIVWIDQINILIKKKKKKSINQYSYSNKIQFVYSKLLTVTADNSKLTKE